MSRVNETINEQIRRLAGRTVKPAGKNIPAENRAMNAWLRGETVAPEDPDPAAPGPHIVRANAGSGTGTTPAAKGPTFNEWIRGSVRRRWRRW